MENKNINKEITKFCEKITKTETEVAILATNKGILMAGNKVHLLGTLAMILEKMRAVGIPEELLKNTFELSMKSDSELEEQAKAVNEKIEKLLNLLKEISNE